MKSINVKVKRVNPDATMPVYANPGDAGMDLRCMEDVTLGPGETMTVGTGVAMEIPEGYVGLVFPRSGLGSRGMTLSNCVGVIDSSYRGEIGAPLHNNHPVMREETITTMPDGSAVSRYFHTDERMSVSKGERVCQIAFFELPKVTLEEVDELGSSERGTGGFGSSGQE